MTKLLSKTVSNKPLGPKKPGQVTHMTGLDPINQDIQHHPESKNAYAIDVVIAALQETYPCK